MKRHSSAAMISIFPNASGDEIDQLNDVVPAEKKRRLSANQVEALEKSFEVEEKLEPERKAKLALELGLQPRQVAVWFQNRRARCKSKRLERDYGALEADYDVLKFSYEDLRHENEALLKEISELKGKQSAKPSLEIHQENVFLSPKCEETIVVEKINNGKMLLCDSNSSAVSNEDSNSNSNSSPNAAVSTSSPYQLLDLQTSSSSLSKDSGMSINGDKSDSYEHRRFLKTEEQEFFNGAEEESCFDLFSDYQAPSLPWICSDDWNQFNLIYE